MVFIEGVGDEVVWFVSLMLGLLIALLAWWSTGYRQERMRTVVVMDRNMRHIYRAFVQHPVTFSIRRTVVQESTEMNNSSSATQTQHIPLRDIQTDTVDHLNNSASEDSPDSPSRSTDTDTGGLASTEQIAEMESIVNAMDSDANVIRNRRVAFFQQPRSEQTSDTDTNTTNLTSALPDQDSASLPERLAKIINRQKGSIPAENENCQEQKGDDVPSDNIDVPQADTELTNEERPRAEDNIRIRIKYLNEDQKLVQASLQEQMGDFKRRHFSNELSSRGGSLVRLIFAGRLLREAETLGDAGLYDNCVVHCLIHQPRNPQYHLPGGSAANTGQNEFPGDGNQGPQVEGNGSPDTNRSPSRDWDLGHALFTLVSMMLTVAWYCHYQYSHLFGAAASVALLGLTGLYVVAVIGVYYPDHQFQFNGIPVPPQNAPETTNQG